MRGLWRLLFLGGLCIGGCALGRDFDGYSAGTGDAGTRVVDAGEASSASPCAADASFTSDSRNCGVCGHDCLGGACSDGRCQAVVLARGVPEMTNLALDGADVFFTSQAAERTGRVPKSGGDIVDLARGYSSFVVAARGDEVFFGGNATNLRRTRRVGNAVSETLHDIQPGILLATPSALFYTDYHGGETGKSAFYRRALDGKVTTVRDGLTGCEAIDVRGDFAYFAENGSGAPEPKIWRWPLAGGEPTVVVQAQARRLVVDDAFVYFINFDDERISRVPVGGGKVEPIAVAPASFRAGNIAVDDAFLYVTVEQSGRDGGGIYRLSKTGGVLTALADDAQERALGLALDEQAIYWTESEAGLLKKLAK